MHGNLVGCFKWLQFPSRFNEKWNCQKYRVAQTLEKHAIKSRTTSKESCVTINARDVWHDFFRCFFWLIFSFNKNANQSLLVGFLSQWNIFILISCITFCYDVYLETSNPLYNFIHSISYVFVILIRKFQKIRKIIGILRNSRKISNLKLIKKFNLKPFESRFEYLTSN